MRCVCKKRGRIICSCALERIIRHGFADRAFWHVRPGGNVVLRITRYRSNNADRQFFHLDKEAFLQPHFSNSRHLKSYSSKVSQRLAGRNAASQRVRKRNCFSPSQSPILNRSPTNTYGCLSSPYHAHLLLPLRSRRHATLCYRPTVMPFPSHVPRLALG